MKNLLVNVEVAKLLKEINYELNPVHHVTEGEIIYNLGEAISKFAIFDEVKLIAVPTFEEASKWLRDNYNIYIFIRPVIIKDNYLRFNTYVYKYREKHSNPLYLEWVGGNSYTYEDANNFGLKIALLTIINNKDENTKA